MSPTNVSPRFLNVVDSPRPAHRSEIMTSGWWAGGWVVWESIRIRPKVPRLGPARRLSRCQRTGRSMWSAPRNKVATHKATGEGGDLGGCPVAGHPRLLAMRHGMLPRLGAISPKPRSAGEARASLQLRTTRVGAIASPAPLRCSHKGQGLWTTRGLTVAGRPLTPAAPLPKTERRATLRSRAAR